MSNKKLNQSNQSGSSFGGQSSDSFALFCSWTNGIYSTVIMSAPEEIIESKADSDDQSVTTEKAAGNLVSIFTPVALCMVVVIATVAFFEYYRTQGEPCMVI